MRKTTFQKLFALGIILGVLILSHGVFSRSGHAEDGTRIYLPLAPKYYPPVTITDIWVGNANGFERSNFLPGEALRYIIVGSNNTPSPLNVNIQWNQIGPCGATQVFSGTLTLAPGLWVQVQQANAPSCLGTYTNTVLLTVDKLTITQTTNFNVVNYTSEIVFSDKQGFDKCGLPTVNQMQTWWNNSPYWVFNLYLGGIRFACPDIPLNASWVWQVSQQGWEFILTWVGPQSPCYDNNVSKNISTNITLARQQGQSEADLAIAAAENLGLGGDKIIYYDLEAYTDSAVCRNAVDSFITGWTERLHERGFKAGAYGTPCTSYISDWWNNNPRLDDIWIARWILPYQYREDVSVLGAICGLTDSMWPNQQRLRQYAGGHSETWGDVPLTIDSNVLLGEITAITTSVQTSAASSFGASLASQPLLREAQLLNAHAGWVLKGNELWSTRDAAQTWDVITPPGVDTILSVDFPDPATGWLVSLSDSGELVLHSTRDGGTSWDRFPLQISGSEIGAVYLDFLDDQTGWLVAKIPSSSSFSRGRLFATSDGGFTWEERSVPLGEPVWFSDPQQGWVAGGPQGNQFYYTLDGGKTWTVDSEQAFQQATTNFTLAKLPENTAQTSQPDAVNAWAIAQSGACSGDKASGGPLTCWQQTQLWMTADGGQTWVQIAP